LLLGRDERRADVAAGGRSPGQLDHPVEHGGAGGRVGEAGDLDEPVALEGAEISAGERCSRR
jgi:hypothetical protein